MRDRESERDRQREIDRETDKDRQGRRQKDRNIQTGGVEGKQKINTKSDRERERETLTDKE